MKIAIYPGSFDPITLGHLNIIKRAAACFDKLIVCVMVNASKKTSGLFTPEERVELIRKTVAKLPNVEVDHSCELVAEYAKAKKACTLIKGLRAVSDYEYELQMAQTNRVMAPDIDTIFLTTNLRYSYLSSTTVKEIAFFHGKLEAFLHPEVARRVEEKMKKLKNH